MTTLQTLIWLFPLTFFIHDLEEIIFWKKWLKKNGKEIKTKVPKFAKNTFEYVSKKSTAEALVPMLLIFCLTILSSYLAMAYRHYLLFVFANSVFLVHGFMHIGQSVILKRYVPAVFTSALVILPYGFLLFSKLIENGIVDVQTLIMNGVVAIVFVIPFILFMHKVGDVLLRCIRD